MKSIFNVFVCVLLLAGQLRAEPISVEEYLSIRDAHRRAEILAQASPEQKTLLMAAEHHADLLARYGSEAEIVNMRERKAAFERGYHYLTGLMPIQKKVWMTYLGESLGRNRAAGMNSVDANAILQKGKQEMDALAAHDREFTDLLLNLAPTPAASELEARAQVLVEKWENFVDHSAILPPVTEAERAGYDTSVAEIMARVKTLPKLDPAQAQKELDAVSEKEIYFQRGVD